MLQTHHQLTAVLPELEPTWHEILHAQMIASYFLKLRDFLSAEHQAGYTIYPAVKDIFNAFAYTPFPCVRVVILGQDPYHGPGQAHGLSFSVKRGVTPPPSLKNIYKELESDIPCTLHTITV